MGKSAVKIAKAKPDKQDSAPAAVPAPPKSKLQILLDLLQREDGATIFEMAEATGWQFHSVRGAMAGSIKKKLGLEITSEKPGNERIYRASKPIDAS